MIRILPAFWVLARSLLYSSEEDDLPFFTAAGFPSALRTLSLEAQPKKKDDENQECQIHPDGYFLLHAAAHEIS